MSTSEHGFEVVWEIEPPLRADVGLLHAQLDVASRVTTTVLVPDNHIGQATVSSIAIAREVRTRALHPIACLNARDRNLLGLRRDLLTCDLDGIDDLLLVYGDEPEVGSRASDLTVRTMVQECRQRSPHVRLGVTTRLGSLPAWKLAADRLFVQVSYDVDALLRWRDQIRFEGPVYPAILVVPSVAMAHRLAARVPALRVPDRWLESIDRDPNAGVELAAALAERLRESGAFEGIHMVSGRRHREASSRLRGLAAPAQPRSAVAV